ncbi:MAG: DUF2442 domain-containing protein [bacterium]|nr:DUF2442 domain-containing protein [bacterium]
MNILTSEPRALSLTFDADNLWLDLADGRKLGVPLAFFPRLLHAQPSQRERYELSGAGTGIHWDELDEDISVKHLLLGFGDQTRSSRQPETKTA